MLFDYYEITPELDDAEWKRMLTKNNKAFEKGSTWG